MAATEALRPDGIVGIITSNRFLSTLGGSSLRSYLARQYEIDEVIDLGDTKLFEAAVLPAIFVGRRRSQVSSSLSSRPTRFLKIYSQTNCTDSESVGFSSGASVLDVLRRGEPGRYQVTEGVFRLTCGDLVFDGDPKGVWSLTSTEEAAWLQRVRAGARGVFRDVAMVRVGIKTTADEVFIRSDWDALPAEIRPEPELLRPLLGHADIRLWTLPEGMQPSARVLYPHEVSDGCRRAVDLRRYPRARAYLEAHRERLEKRYYVLEAGRRWYEIWVPQDPDAWPAPKIVFPDISPEPRFLVDFAGHLVDGNCYWITLRPGVPPDMLYLLLGVANSDLMTRFHDLAFNNMLYSARRRYITQYVAKYPFPDPSSPASRELVDWVKCTLRKLGSAQGPINRHGADGLFNFLVEEAFGLRPDDILGQRKSWRRDGTRRPEHAFVTFVI